LLTINLIGNKVAWKDDNTTISSFQTTLLPIKLNVNKIHKSMIGDSYNFIEYSMMIMDSNSSIIPIGRISHLLSGVVLTRSLLPSYNLVNLLLIT